MTKKIVIILTVLIMLSASVISFATSTTDLNNKKNEIENKIDDAENRKDEISDEMKEVLKELDTLNAEISEKEDQISDLNAELKKLNEEISELQKQLDEQQRKYDEQYNMLGKRLVAQYKAGTATYLDVLLNSKSLTDFISKYYILGKIAQYDTELLNSIETKKQEIEGVKSQLDSKKSELTQKQTELKLEERILSNKKGNKNKYVAQLTDEQKELQRQIDELNEEARKIEEEIREAARKAGSNGGGFVYTGGQLEWPCPNYTRISSYFGYRGAAATGGVGSSNHKGIDIASARGNSIVAAESGVVIKVVTGCTHNYAKTYSTRCNCGGGYGNYVMVSHGGNLVTLYGHCTSINVTTGQTVTRGQTIATVGCTGYSTGNHLHFGVLLNGTYVNPASYLNM